MRFAAAAQVILSPRDHAVPAVHAPFIPPIRGQLRYRVSDTGSIDRTELRLMLVLNSVSCCCPALVLQVGPVAAVYKLFKNGVLHSVGTDATKVTLMLRAIAFTIFECPGLLRGNITGMGTALLAVTAILTAVHMNAQELFFDAALEDSSRVKQPCILSGQLRHSWRHGYSYLVSFVKPGRLMDTFVMFIYF